MDARQEFLYGLLHVRHQDYFKLSFCAGMKSYIPSAQNFRKIKFCWPSDMSIFYEKYFIQFMKTGLFLVMIIWNSYLEAQVPWPGGMYRTDKPSALINEPQKVVWMTSLEEAAALAVKIKAPLFVHFYSPECGPCRDMERVVFSDAEVMCLQEKYYIMVKVNVLENREALKHFGIHAVPTDMIFSHEGRLVAKSVGGKSKEKYCSFWRSVACRMRYTPRAENVAQALVNTHKPAELKSAVRVSTGDSKTMSDVKMKKRESEEKISTEPHLPPGFAAGEIQKDEVQTYIPEVRGNMGSRVMLDGYCPVTLVESEKWLRGDPRYGVSHRGYVYLFGSEQLARKFFENPDYYAVAAGGYDVVRLMDQHRYEVGTREYGLRYDGVNFVFSCEESREIFRQDPEKYIAPIRLEHLRTAGTREGKEVF
ncbi:MAG: thioredoxin domain-containing protein [Planctomycetia bacterium]|nr:thioredoxin domain-containing protein [Planctomycetia bacterium]